jgi:uncharacterized SAM-binding protein YcdF (DUF218 family)
MFIPNIALQYVIGRPSQLQPIPFSILDQYLEPGSAILSAGGTMLENILFYFSKLAGPLSDPRTVLFAALIVGIALLWTSRRKSGRIVVSATVAAAIGLNAAPIGPIAVAWIENLVPAPTRLPDRIDGIVVLGGDINTRMMRLRPVSPGGDATRLIAFADLARRYPNARLVFTGGTGRILDRTDTEADGARRLLPLLGLDPARVLFEDQSRNTYENAVFALELARPAEGENWLLVTSAFHMPRSLSAFRKAGWIVTPYPVGYLTPPGAEDDWTIPTAFDGRLRMLAVAMREIAGYVYYFATGRVETLLPRQ